MLHPDADLIARPADDAVLHVEILGELPGLMTRKLVAPVLRRFFHGFFDLFKVHS